MVGGTQNNPIRPYLASSEMFGEVRETPGLVAVVIFLFGRLGGRGVLFVVGVFSRCLVVSLGDAAHRLTISTQVLMFSGLFLVFQLVSKGNIEFQVVKVSMVAMILWLSLSFQRDMPGVV